MCPSRRAPAIQLWLSRLSAISDVMDQWLLVQNMWMYMEAVFRYHDDGMAYWLIDLGERSPQGCAASRMRTVSIS